MLEGRQLLGTSLQAREEAEEHEEHKCKKCYAERETAAKSLKLQYGHLQVRGGNSFRVCTEHSCGGFFSA